jgi:hypothetical protein
MNVRKRKDVFILIFAHRQAGYSIDRPPCDGIDLGPAKRDVRHNLSSVGTIANWRQEHCQRASQGSIIAVR